MGRGALPLLLLAALVSAVEDIESREHWKAEAIKLKAQESTSKAALREAESTNEAQAVKIKAQESTSKAAINELKAQLAEQSRLGESLGRRRRRKKKRQAEEAAQKKAEEEAAQKKAEAPTSLVAKAAAAMSSSPAADSAANATADGGLSGTQGWADYEIKSGPRPLSCTPLKISSHPSRASSDKYKQRTYAGGHLWVKNGTHFEGSKWDAPQARFDDTGITHWKTSNELAFG